MDTTKENVTAIEKQPENHGSVERTRSTQLYRPNVDIVESTDELTLLADMPGVSRDDIDISFENSVLTIRGFVKERQCDRTSYLWREYGVGDFYRTFQVSEEIDAARISAEYHNGVLMLHLPKSEKARPRRIAVKTS